jgi:hypothetical protein
MSSEERPSQVPDARSGKNPDMLAFVVEIVTRKEVVIGVVLGVLTTFVLHLMAFTGIVFWEEFLGDETRRRLYWVVQFWWLAAAGFEAAGLVAVLLYRRGVASARLLVVSFVSTAVLVFILPLGIIAFFERRREDLYFAYLAVMIVLSCTIWIQALARKRGMLRSS